MLFVGISNCFGRADGWESGDGYWSDAKGAEIKKNYVRLVLFCIVFGVKMVVVMGVLVVLRWGVCVNGRVVWEGYGVIGGLRREQFK